MKPLLKYTLWAVAGLLALFVLGAVTLYILVPREKIIARVVPAAEAALGRKVHLADAGISLWPPFGVYLSELRVENREPGPQPDLLRVERLRGQLAWRPLLSAELRFSSLSVIGLAFHYEQIDDSTSNLSDLLSGQSGVWPVLVEKLEFENLALSMADRRDTSAWSLAGIEAGLVLDPVQLGFEGQMFVPGARVQRGQRDTTYEGPLQASFEGQLQKNPLEITFTTLQGTLRDLPWGGEAAFKSAPAGMTIDGSLSLGPVTVPQILAHLPAARRAALSRYDISGDLKVSVTARGPLDSLASGAASAELSWSQGRISDSLGEWLSFTQLSIPVDHEGFHVDADRVVSRYGPVRVAAVGTWPPEGRLELSVSGQSDMAALTQSAAGKASGTVEWSASALGPLEEPSRWKLGARAQLRAVRFEEEGREPFEVESGELSYDGSSLRVEGLQARCGGSDLKLEGEVGGLSWVDYMADRPMRPEAEMRLRSHRLDLDMLFPDLAGDSAAPADTGARPPLPPVHASLSADLDTLILGGVTWSRVHAEFRLAEGRCLIDTLYGSVFGGRVHLGGQIDSLEQESAPYEFRLRADSLEIGDLLGRFGAAGRHLRGKSNLEAKVNGRGATSREVVEALVMDGSVNLFNTRLEKLELAHKVQTLLGLQLQDPIPLRSASNRFRFEGGRTRVEDFKFNTPQGAWVLGGSAGLDGSLDYSLSGKLPPEVASRLSLPDAWFAALPSDWRGRVDPLDLLKDDEGAVGLFFKIGGTLRSPEVSVDMDTLQPLLMQRFEARLKEKVTDEAKQELKEGLKGLLDKFKR